jgi:beta-glucosidase/6-phospho-beta-glucosidase/beta-galactosidase
MSEIIEKLDGYGISAERKSIYTDLDTLREYGLNVEVKREKSVSYYVANRTRYDPENVLKSTPVASFYSAPGQRYAPYPAGLFDVVQYVHERYNGIEIYITENGCAILNINDKEKEIVDPERISYLREHIRMCCR